MKYAVEMGQGAMIYEYIPIIIEGRAIAQAVSRRLPTAAVRVETRVWSCGIL
jgi:hypothetical protein